MIQIDMDMPKSCKECPLTYTDTGDDAYFGTNTERCVFDRSEISHENSRYDDCPLSNGKDNNVTTTDAISREVARRIIDSGRTREQMLEMVESAVTFEECDDCISRSEAIRIASGYCHWSSIPEELAKLPSVKPKFTDEEIQTMQDLEQAEIEKAYKLGKAEGQEGEDAISRQAALDDEGLSELGGIHEPMQGFMLPNG